VVHQFQEDLCEMAGEDAIECEFKGNTRLGRAGETTRVQDCRQFVGKFSSLAGF
jgi:hypothetical protein